MLAAAQATTLIDLRNEEIERIDLKTSTRIGCCGRNAGWPSEPETRQWHSMLLAYPCQYAYLCTSFNDSYAWREL